jgi:hypothetical protein
MSSQGGKELGSACASQSTAEALEALLPWNVKPALQVHDATGA